MVYDKVVKLPSILVDLTSSSWARHVLTNARLAVEVFDGMGHSSSGIVRFKMLFSSKNVVLKFAHKQMYLIAWLLLRVRTLVIGIGSLHSYMMNNILNKALD
nr:retrovirus-related Pol polyprotein from transposon TNT 1-94 [Tanacetum cinerariifolium]